MARLIPNTCDLERRPFSERLVFNAIKAHLSDAWVVFHSFDYVSRDLNRKRWDGEIDFLLYNPNLGILILEVKGGSIAHRNGEWFQNDHLIDPVVQAKRNKYALRTLLEKALHRDIPLRFAHAVCFPDCSAERKNWPLEAKGIVLTGDKLPGIEEFATAVLEAAQLPTHLSGTIAEGDIMRVLTPFFEYGERLIDRITIEERQFFLFTEQQCAILNALELFNRLQIRGCAGSGKTIMAIKKAEQLAQQEKKVLLLCYNQLLARQLKKKLSGIEGIRVAAFFDYCIALLNLKSEQVDRYRNDPRLYFNVLPKLVLDYLAKTNLTYDAVIVDEAQDFSPEAWYVIERLPKPDGHFYIFYDPDQNIFNKELHLPDFGLPPVSLTKNCRNTRTIFNALKPYLSIEATVLETTPAGADIHILRGNPRLNLEKALETLVKTENIPRADIVILGAHALKNTSIGTDPQIGRFHIAEAGNLPRPNEIRYCTYMKYKGCEAKIVILLDVDDSDPRWRDPRGIYTAMSRAIHQLIIIRRES